MTNLSLYNYAYLVGIGGVSMSSLALILKNRGYTVRGYDRTESAETRMLVSNGIPVSYTTEAPELDGVNLLIYTAAVNLEHPIIAEAIRRGIKVIRRAELLGAVAAGYRVSVGVAGTHGKSTTSGMISYIFDKAPGHNPSYAVGAYLPFAKAYYKVGGDDTFIFEADEYKDSFLEFYPTTSVVLNVCPDHPDYFKSLLQEKNSFSEYISHSKIAVVNKDNANAASCTEGFSGKTVFFSVRGEADYYAENIKTEGGSSYDLVYPDGKIHITLAVPGEHNISNSVAAFAACFENGLPADVIASGLSTFGGIARRFEKVREINGATVYSDYAHHPDEICACIATARSVSSGRVIGIFQPHTFSRLNALFGNFASSLSECDRIAVTDVFSARETNIWGVDSKKLAEATGADYLPTLADCAEYIKKTAAPGDTIILIGAGDIDKVRNML